MSTGTAKPTPTLPPPDERIWELIPITRPRASSSGPPELPRLIAASVWIASLIEKSVSASIVRSLAEIDADRQRVLLAERAADRRDRLADLSAPVCPRSAGRASRPVGSTFSSPTSAFGSKPTIFASTWLPSANWT